MWQWLSANSSTLAVLISVVPIAWGAMTYLAQKRQELRDKRFQTYHELIKWVVEGAEKDVPPMVDRQLAAVYELRRFPEYFEPSLRILSGLGDKTWSYARDVKHPAHRLIEEIDDTADWIEEQLKSRTRMPFTYLQWLKRKN